METAGALVLQPTARGGKCLGLDPAFSRKIIGEMTAHGPEMGITQIEVRCNSSAIVCFCRGATEEIVRGFIAFIMGLVTDAQALVSCRKSMFPLVTKA